MSGIAKRVTQLSDGRELIYFDDADTALPPERKPDERPPEPRPPLPDLRLDPLTGEWISIATARQNRAFLPPADLDRPVRQPGRGGLARRRQPGAERR